MSTTIKEKKELKKSVRFITETQYIFNLGIGESSMPSDGGPPIGLVGNPVAIFVMDMTAPKFHPRFSVRHQMTPPQNESESRKRKRGDEGDEQVPSKRVKKRNGGVARVNRLQRLKLICRSGYQRDEVIACAEKTYDLFKTTESYAQLMKREEKRKLRERILAQQRAASIYWRSVKGSPFYQGDD